jgi:glycine/serine hydroxymethyltransferase
MFLTIISLDESEMLSTEPVENLWFFSGKKISAASIYFQSLPFKVDPETGLIDYEKLEETALLYRPRILICGGSSYPREWDYARFRQIADKVNAILMCDMAHISGLVVAQVLSETPAGSPYCNHGLWR